MKKLTIKEEAFAKSFLRHKHQYQAYVEAYKPRSSLRPGAIYRLAWDISRRPHVTARIDELRNMAAKEAISDIAAVIKECSDIVLADANELSQYRRTSCRRCYGSGHNYHWRDEHEWAHATAKAIDSGRRAPDNSGGYGFDHRRDPNPNCPECLGEGIGEVFLTDSRKLSERARKLYKGARVTRNGVEVLTRDQDRAMALLAQLLAPSKEEGTGDLKITFTGGLGDD